MFIRSVLGKFDIGFNKIRVVFIKYRYCLVFFFKIKRIGKRIIFKLN